MVPLLVVGAMLAVVAVVLYFRAQRWVRTIDESSWDGSSLAAYREQLKDLRRWTAGWSFWSFYLYMMVAGHSLSWSRAGFGQMAAAFAVMVGGQLLLSAGVARPFRIAHSRMSGAPLDSALSGGVLWFAVIHMALEAAPFAVALALRADWAVTLAALAAGFLAAELIWDLLAPFRATVRAVGEVPAEVMERVSRAATGTEVPASARIAQARPGYDATVRSVGGLAGMRFLVADDCLLTALPAGQFEVLALRALVPGRADLRLLQILLRAVRYMAYAAAVFALAAAARHWQGQMARSPSADLLAAAFGSAAVGIGCAKLVSLVSTRQAWVKDDQAAKLAGGAAQLSSALTQLSELNTTRYESSLRFRDERIVRAAERRLGQRLNRLWLDPELADHA